MSHCPLCLPKAKSNFPSLAAVLHVMSFFKCSAVCYSIWTIQAGFSVYPHNNLRRTLSQSIRHSVGTTAKRQNIMRQSRSCARSPILALPAELPNHSWQDIKSQNEENDPWCCSCTPPEDGQLCSRVAHKQSPLAMGASDLESLGQGLYLCSGHGSTAGTRSKAGTTT